MQRGFSKAGHGNDVGVIFLCSARRSRLVGEGSDLLRGALAEPTTADEVNDHQNVGDLLHVNQAQVSAIFLQL